MNILIMNRKYGDVFGGVEYMSTTLANEMTARGHKCHLISFDAEDAKILYDLDPSIQWHKISNYPIEKKATWRERAKRFKAIRKVMRTEEIDVAIGFQDGAFLSLATSALGLNIPVIAAERNSPGRFDHTHAGKFRALRFQTFRLAHKVTIQCESFSQKYPKYVQNKIITIPNPVFPVMGQCNPVGSSDQKTILSVGRLSYQKNFAVLIKAFSLLASKNPTWQLILVGDGEDRHKLENFSKELNIQNQVTFVGYQKNPDECYKQAQIFCLPSLWEGFPNALAEALSYGLPSVGFSDCGGVCDLISHEKNGMLAQGYNDPETLAQTLGQLMASDSLREKYSIEAKKITEQYDPKNIYDCWEKLFTNSANA